MAIILQIAVPIPLRQVFDYLYTSQTSQAIEIGMRVKVSFQNRQLIGIITNILSATEIHLSKLKPVIGVIDDSPVLTTEVLQLCQWAADYYHYPIGEVIFHALPSLLRQGKHADYTKESYYRLTENGKRVDLEKLKRSPRQIELLNLLVAYPQGLTIKQLKKYKITKAIIKNLCNKNLIEYTTSANTTFLTHAPPILHTHLTLNPEQRLALEAINKNTRIFQVFLLDGITGSGKTEIYLQAISNILQHGKQVLILVPEIGLTPQTILRFRERFAVPVVAVHSGLSEKERLNAWLATKFDDAKIIIGTRSAIFSPFANLGLIVIDEEHDLSFKQQEGLRYHARDLAIMRAHYKGIPIILGSATPALETLQKARNGRYQHLKLSKRAGHALIPEFDILDIRKVTLEQGLSNQLIQAIKKQLEAGDQVMLFLNRRGYAPVLLCHSCGWMSVCKRCDARMTYHQSPPYLHCHHCDARRSLPMCCEICQEKNLTTIGLGTERLEEILQTHFPGYAIARIDRDTTQRRGAMEKILNQIQQGEFQILIGTQMLAKGHHFPNVTLVAIVDADSGFFSSDFRALERMGQLVLQVSGRAGRVEKQGKVIIQTHHPEHPLLHQLIHNSYHQFALAILEERQQALLPPYSFFALFRAEAHNAFHAHDFLKKIKEIAQSSSENIQLLGPIASPMPKRAGKHRTQLLLQSSHRPLLQNFLKMLIPEVEKISGKQRVRWSLDVDPLEMF